MNSDQDSTGPKIRFVRRSIKGRPKLCPRCLAQLHLANSLAGWMTPEEYICESCGYHGHVALEPSKQEEEENPS